MYSCRHILLQYKTSYCNFLSKQFCKTLFQNNRFLPLVDQRLLWKSGEKIHLQYFAHNFREFTNLLKLIQEPPRDLGTSASESPLKAQNVLIITEALISPINIHSSTKWEKRAPTIPGAADLQQSVGGREDHKWPKMCLRPASVVTKIYIAKV